MGSDTTASAPSATAFEWPPSTRLSYTLEGDYRGPVHGSAQVEWLRRGDHYQVHLEVSVIPVFSRRISSDGVLTDRGLSPRRYDEVTEIAFRQPRRVTVSFDSERVQLANGTEAVRPDGVQDTASQFVQLTWLFTTQPQRLRAGETIEVPLALPRRVDRWLYDVQPEEELYTPMGRVKAFRLKPRRDMPRDGELSIDTWFAPTLQYLPVRILIHQDAKTYMDLMLDRVPLQAAPESAATPPR